jgi:hypothetical protein
VYHIIDSIQSFGAINGYTTETYESLHKEYVKVPYQLSNKKDIEVQIMKIVCINIYTNFRKKTKKTKKKIILDSSPINC